MSKNVTVICPFSLDAGLLTGASQLGTVRALVQERDAATAARYGAERIHTLPDGFLCTDEAAFALWLSERLMSWGDEVILASATVQLRSILAMTAWHIQAGLTADCTALSMENGRLLQTRPAFGNSLMADIITLSSIQMATVRPGTFRAAENPKSAKVTAETPPYAGAAVRILEEISETNSASLHQAHIVVAGGVGIGSKEGFSKLEQLANKLGGAVAASRSAVDAGFAPYACQVGMTGVTVSPKLYIAIGISGAVQHLAGMSGAEKIIAINTDPKAPIFNYADYGFVGDWQAVIHNLLEELS